MPFPNAQKTPPFVIPDKFSTRYKVVKYLSEGSFGRVYEVESLASRNHYALKLVRYKDEREHEHMKKEMQFNSALSHPNVVSVHECMDDVKNRQIVFLMELCNKDLSGLIEDRRRAKAPFEEADVWKIIAQLVNGIDYMHHPPQHEIQRGRLPMLHRDLKPGNILVKGPALKVCDLGLSRFLEVGEQAGSFLGTREYMAPEVARREYAGTAAYGTPSDLWPIGIILFEIAYRHFPFPTKSDGTPKTYNLPHLGTLSPTYSTTLRATITGLLQINPRLRTTTQTLLSMTEIRGALLDLENDKRRASANELFEKAKADASSAAQDKKDAARDRAEAARDRARAGEDRAAAAADRTAAAADRAAAAQEMRTIAAGRKDIELGVAEFDRHKLRLEEIFKPAGKRNAPDDVFQEPAPKRARLEPLEVAVVVRPPAPIVTVPVRIDRGFPKAFFSFCHEWFMAE